MSMGFHEHISLLQKIVNAIRNIMSQFANDNFDYFAIKNYKVEYHKTLTHKEFIIISKNSSECYKNKILKMYAKAMILDDLTLLTEEIEKMVK